MKLLTCAWTFFFLATARPDWLRTLCGSKPLEVSFRWCPWEPPWNFMSTFLFWKLPEHVPPCALRALEMEPLLCLSIEDGQTFVAIGSSKSVRNFIEYLSLTRYNSIRRFSTALISSLIYWRSVCTYRGPPKMQFCKLISKVYSLKKDLKRVPWIAINENIFWQNRMDRYTFSHAFGAVWKSEAYLMGYWCSAFSSPNCSRHWSTTSIWPY